MVQKNWFYANFEDGPMAGRGFKVESAEFPFFLRVFRSSNDNWDVLDRPDVEPPSGGEVFAYWMVSRVRHTGMAMTSLGIRLGGKFTKYTIAC